MTILNELIVPKDNADDKVLVSKLYFSNGEKIQKGDELAELETSKTSISITSEDIGYIEYCVSEDDYVKVGEVIIKIHSSKKSVNESLNIKTKDKSGRFLSKHPYATPLTINIEPTFFLFL